MPKTRSSCWFSNVWWYHPLTVNVRESIHVGDTRHSKGAAIADKRDYWHHTWETNSKDRPLDPLRDRLCSHAQRLTGSARVAESESIVAGCFECFRVACVADIGLVEVGRSPIRWVDAVTDGNEYLWGEIDFGTQDQRQLPRLGIRAEGIRSFRVFGRVLDLSWNATNGGDKAKRIATSLTSNQQIRETFLSTRSLDDDVVINTCTEHNRWWIGTLWEDPQNPVPTEKWACYEMIAQHLSRVDID